MNVEQYQTDILILGSGGAGLFAAPCDARPEVRARAALVTQAAGGAGAVRELAERVLRARGEWQARLERAAGLPNTAPESAE